MDRKMSEAQVSQVIVRRTPNHVNNRELERRSRPDSAHKGNLKRLKTSSVSGFQRWEKENELLWAMLEDETEWLAKLFPDIIITPELFFYSLEDGVVLCRLANRIQENADEYGEKNNVKVCGKRFKYHKSIAKKNKQLALFKSRENVQGFLTWCRQLGISDSILFESNDIVEADECREGCREVVICLMEIARRASGRYKFTPIPKLIQLEKEIEAEELQDAANNEIDQINYASSDEESTDSTGHSPSAGFDGSNSVVTDDGVSGNERTTTADGEKKKPKTNRSKSELDKEVFKIIDNFNVYNIRKIKEGKYLILGKLIFVRMLNGHVLLRIGGGWDTLEHYLLTHLPKAVQENGNIATDQSVSPSVSKTPQKSQLTKLLDKVKKEQQLKATPPSPYRNPAALSVKSSSKQLDNSNGDDEKDITSAIRKIEFSVNQNITNRRKLSKVSAEETQKTTSTEGNKNSADFNQNNISPESKLSETRFNKSPSGNTGQSIRFKMEDETCRRESGFSEEINGNDDVSQQNGGEKLIIFEGESIGEINGSSTIGEPLQKGEDEIAEQAKDVVDGASLVDLAISEGTVSGDIQVSVEEPREDPEGANTDEEPLSAGANSAATSSREESVQQIMDQAVFSEDSIKEQQETPALDQLSENLTEPTNILRRSVDDVTNDSDKITPATEVSASNVVIPVPVDSDSPDFTAPVPADGASTDVPTSPAASDSADDVLNQAPADGPFSPDILAPVPADGASTNVPTSPAASDSADDVLNQAAADGAFSPDVLAPVPADSASPDILTQVSADGASSPEFLAPVPSDGPSSPEVPASVLADGVSPDIPAPDSAGSASPDTGKRSPVSKDKKVAESPKKKAVPGKTTKEPLKTRPVSAKNTVAKKETTGARTKTAHPKTSGRPPTESAAAKNSRRPLSAAKTTTSTKTREPPSSAGNSTVRKTSPTPSSKRLPNKADSKHPESKPATRPEQKPATKPARPTSKTTAFGSTVSRPPAKKPDSTTRPATAPSGRSTQAKGKPVAAKVQTGLSSSRPQSARPKVTTAEGKDATDGGASSTGTGKDVRPASPTKPLVRKTQTKTVTTLKTTRTGGGGGGKPEVSSQTIKTTKTVTEVNGKKTTLKEVAPAGRKPLRMTRTETSETRKAPAKKTESGKPEPKTGAKKVEGKSKVGTTGREVSAGAKKSTGSLGTKRATTKSGVKAEQKVSGHPGTIPKGKSVKELPNPLGITKPVSAATEIAETGAQPSEELKTETSAQEDAKHLVENTGVLHSDKDVGDKNGVVQKEDEKVGEEDVKKENENVQVEEKKEDEKVQEEDTGDVKEQEEVVVENEGERLAEQQHELVRDLESSGLEEDEGFVEKEVEERVDDVDNLTGSDAADNILEQNGGEIPENGDIVREEKHEQFDETGNDGGVTTEYGVPVEGSVSSYTTNSVTSEESVVIGNHFGKISLPETNDQLDERLEIPRQDEEIFEDSIELSQSITDQDLVEETKSRTIETWSAVEDQKESSEESSEEHPDDEGEKRLDLAETNENLPPAVEPQVCPWDPLATEDVHDVPLSAVLDTEKDSEYNNNMAEDFARTLPELVPACAYPSQAESFENTTADQMHEGAPVMGSDDKNSDPFLFGAQNGDATKFQELRSFPGNEMSLEDENEGSPLTVDDLLG